MYRGISESLAALLGLSVIGSTAATAAPLTGHTVNIEISPVNTATPVVVINETVDALLPEADSTDSSFFDNSDFIDVGPNFITISADGLPGSAGFGSFDLEIEIGGPANFEFAGSIYETGSLFAGAVQVLSERILIEDLLWNFGTLHISGLTADIDPPTGGVPLPGSMALLGIGLAGIGLRNWDSFLKISGR